VKTAPMRGIDVDGERSVARVEAGVVWRELVEAAAAHGLAALAGSSPDVGVVGYALGGGLGWLGRKHGLAANALESAEIVTADGRIVRVDRETEPDLFWALRGGGGGFGVVTAVEMRLLPIREVVAGILWWPGERAHEVLDAWRELTERTLPDELTTVGRLLHFPPLEELPTHLRGRSFVVVEVIHLGDAAEADELLAPLRALAPESDTVATVPVESLGSLHMDPEQPTPMVGDGCLLDALTPAAIDALVETAGAGSGSPLVSVELRQLGGELGRARPENGALASLEARCALFAVGIAPTPEAEAHVARHAQLVRRALAPWTARRSYLNFAETPVEPAAFWPEAVYRRLRRIKSALDPANRIQSNHEPL
jgi:FAD/FMN-containing dehydrogenase